MRIALNSFLSFILCCWIYLSIHIFVVYGQCLNDQRSLLLQLKNSLNFTNERSNKLRLWNPQSIDCCHWIGVTCDGEGHVIGLDLSGESISGGFNNSNSLFSLQHLQSLNFAANNFNSAIPSTFNKLQSLTYLNLSYAGFVGQIPMEISQLTRLVTLDISSLAYLAGQQLKLENPSLQKLVQNLKNIRQLYLDGVSISAQGQEWCNALMVLHGLQELSMSSCNLSGPLHSSLTQLQNLSIVRLDQNNLSSLVPESFAGLKNLTTLRLAYCGLKGTFPQKIFQVRTLSFIDISYNLNLSGSFPVFPRNGALQTIIVSNTNFSGALPQSIGDMMQLSILDLSKCQFNGDLPNSLSKLTKLSYLDFSFNKFIGGIPSFGMAKNLTHIDLSHNDLNGMITPAHFEGQQNLISIDLRFNSIYGSIPSSIFTLPSLQKIQLSYNGFSQLDDFTNLTSSTLNTLDLSSNNLSGPIPASIVQLRGLSILQLSSNKFNGSLELNKLLELRNLTTLDLSYNNFLVDVNITDAKLSSLPNISNLKLASCSLKSFPGFLKNLSKLTILDLSDNQIQGVVPNWIWKLDNLQSLNVSHNLLTDLEGPFPNITSSLLVLDLHDNQLQGKIRFLPETAAYIDYSSNNFSSTIPDGIGDNLFGTIYLSLANNNFHGRIPYSLCNATSLQVLDLSSNEFSGTIPSCLMALSGILGVLNLRNNNLSGPIPNVFPSSCALRTLDLHGNILEGKVPESLADCSTLEVLNLGNNQIVDVFPCFLKNISTLRVLVLQKNKFHGHLGCQTNGTWQMLQIVDLAFNKFNGTLPGNCFTRWEAMMYEDTTDSEVKHIQFQVLAFSQINYQDSVTVTSKGQGMELVKILTVFTSIDFSSNHFVGKIPKELFDFKALYALNLSNNALSGQIPSSIGNLKQLESLDLSNNSLEGEIPSEISSLNFLSFLNLSWNHLVGMIPTGTQIQSFESTSFFGNRELCGPPLTTYCSSGDHVSPAGAPKTESATTEFDWQFISVGLGFGVGSGLVVAPLMIWDRGRKWSSDNIDKFLLVLLPMFGFAYTPTYDGDDDDQGDETEENNSNMTDEDEEDESYPMFRGRFCIFCSKLDITMKKVIHDPSCACYHHSSPLSTSTHSSDSFSP